MTTKEEILEKIITLLWDDFTEEVDVNTEFVDTSLDSLDIVELIMKLERHYNINVDDIKANDCDSIKKLVEIIFELTN